MTGGSRRAPGEVFPLRPQLVSFALRRGPGLVRLLAVGLLLLALALAVLVRSGRVRHANPARQAAWAASRAGPAERKQAVERWSEVRESLRERRAELMSEPLGPASRGEARRALDASIGESLTGAWIGTRWSFSGESREPLSGTVACGHWITALLEDAAIPVDPDLGQYASARIVRTFAGRSRTTWLTDRSPGAVVDGVRDAGTGLYLLGLDTHVGLLRVRGRTVDFCHSAGSWPRAVLCEPAITSPSLRSRVHVWGPLLTDRTVDSWLSGARLPTAD